MPYEIEKGIPMPAHTKRKPKYPWADMEVGDSFVVPGTRRPIPPKALRADGWRWRTSVEEGGVRVWRVE